ncbi:hypothetical protein BGZ73_007734 [Actinomortierella ambigua]|nr:hypothetical protein BGZ73_007734 [Actinomortierella ambigua]
MEWERVDQWLQQKFSPQAVPFFERSDESLRILTAMMESNQEQDARAQRVLSEVQYHANAYQSEGERLQTANRVFGLDKANLSPQASSQLDHIVDLALLLGLDSVSLPSFQQALLHHKGLCASADKSERRSRALQSRLDQHLAQANATLQTLQERTQPQLTRQRDEVNQVQIKIWQRHVELLSQKTAEWQHQLQELRAWQQQQQQQQMQHAHQTNNMDSNESNSQNGKKPFLDTIRLGQLQALQSSIQDLELQIADRNQALAVYTELPPDYKLARLKLSEAKFQLEQLLIEQESLMQDLADGL